MQKQPEEYTREEIIERYFDTVHSVKVMLDIINFQLESAKDFSNKELMQNYVKQFRKMIKEDDNLVTSLFNS